MISGILVKLVIGLLLVLAVYFAVELINSCFCRRKDQRVPEAEIRIYFESDYECFEWLIQRMIQCDAVRSCKARLVVVDLICTEESEKWLSNLQRKLCGAFDIERGK